MPSCNDRQLRDGCLQSRCAAVLRGNSSGRSSHSQFHSGASFEPICPHTTKAECVKARTLALQTEPSSSTQQPHAQAVSACSLIHYRPIIRPHTDSLLGHCSYLNTCYSEPTYALSPSIPPLPSSAQHPRLVTGTSGSAAAPNANSPVSLPSGLGAGGRGKEKAPCRYLHYEVDWDETSAGSDAVNAHKKLKAEVAKRSPFKLGIGQGPAGKETQLVRLVT